MRGASSPEWRRDLCRLGGEQLRTNANINHILLFCYGSSSLLCSNGHETLPSPLTIRKRALKIHVVFVVVVVHVYAVSLCSDY